VATARLQNERDVALAPLTTLGVGGPARFFARVEDEAALLEAVRFGRGSGVPLFVLGGGSNLLVADAGFPGLVVQTALGGAIAREDRGDQVRFRVPAGMEWDAFVLAVAQTGLAGVECLAGIPGFVGASPVQNIGAYGQEVASTIRSVRALDLSRLEFVTLTNAECGFAYRTSLFNEAQRDRYLITEVIFGFHRHARPHLDYADLRSVFAGGQPTPLDVYHAVREIRRGKGMLLVPGDVDTQSAGSFFKNPIVPEEVLQLLSEAAGLPLPQVPHWPSADGRVKLSAAWLVERAGFVKGYAMGRAGISSRHALALVNRGGASCAEIVALRDAVVAEVRERFGLTLVQEPVSVGF
jgi:UDP-N-acetylmuramate dehydrogenase